MPRRQKQTKLGKFPVVSPTRGTQQVRKYAAAIQKLPKGAQRASRCESGGPGDISQVHMRTPAELELEEWHLLHERLGWGLGTERGPGSGLDGSSAVKTGEVAETQGLGAIALDNVAAKTCSAENQVQTDADCTFKPKNATQIHAPGFLLEHAAGTTDESRELEIREDGHKSREGTRLRGPGRPDSPADHVDASKLQEEITEPAGPEAHLSPPVPDAHLFDTLEPPLGAIPQTLSHPQASPSLVVPESPPMEMESLNISLIPKKISKKRDAAHHNPHDVDHIYDSEEELSRCVYCV